MFGGTIWDVIGVVQQSKQQRYLQKVSHMLNQWHGKGGRTAVPSPTAVWQLTHTCALSLENTFIPPCACVLTVVKIYIFLYKCVYVSSSLGGSLAEARPGEFVSLEMAAAHVGETSGKLSRPVIKIKLQCKQTRRLCSVSWPAVRRRLRKLVSFLQFPLIYFFLEDNTLSLKAVFCHARVSMWRSESVFCGFLL